jgi:hypothetical protein
MLQEDKSNISKMINETYKKTKNRFYRLIEPLVYGVGGSGAVITLIGDYLENKSMESLGVKIMAPCIFYLLGSKIKETQFRKIPEGSLEEIAAPKDNIDKKINF